jgi:tol-pal system protein YbgF
VRVLNIGIGAAALAAALVSTGCSSQNDIQQLNQNEFTLRGMIASDRQQIDSLQEQVRRLNDQITEIKHGAVAGDTDNSSSHDRIAKLEDEVSALRAGMAATPSGMVPPSTDTGAVGAAPMLPPVMGAVPAPRVASPESPPTWPIELDQEIAEAKSSNEPGIKLYRAGLDAMKDGKYPVAVANFTKLQHAFPKSPLSEPAEYFAANALYETGKYDQAILQFNDLVMRYPKGQYASAALLREAQAFVKLNDRIDARLTLQKLAADHAGTPQAAAAGSMMKDLASD